MKENWRVIPGYPNYQVSDLGRVKSFTRCPKGKILKTVTCDANKQIRRQVVTLVNDFGKKNYKVHSLVLLAFVGPKPDGLVCRHLNGDDSDNRLGNVCYGTYSENQNDAVFHGSRDLQPSAVKKIRKMISMGWSRADVGRKLGISACRVSHIATGRTYKVIV